MIVFLYDFGLAVNSSCDLTSNCGPPTQVLALHQPQCGWKGCSKSTICFLAYVAIIFSRLRGFQISGYHFFTAKVSLWYWGWKCDYGPCMPNRQGYWFCFLASLLKLHGKAKGKQFSKCHLNRFIYIYICVIDACSC